MNVLKALSCLLLCGTLSGAASGQTRLTLEECYTLARQNYPLIKQYDLITRSSRYSVENAGKLYLPQLSVSGQATYQSQTINFGDVIPATIPGIQIPSLSKDQYKIQAEISQQLYDGGVSKLQKESSRANAAIQEQQLEVNLYAIRDRITQLYFGILLMEAQLKQNGLRRADLQSAADKAQAALANGVAYRSNVDELKAEIVNTEMAATEFSTNRQAYMKMLAAFIHQLLSDSTALAWPAPATPQEGIHRPEITYYDIQKKAFDVQEKQLQSNYLPKLNAFIQGAYGRPTLNIVDNKFGPWWIGGVRLNWSLGSLYSLKNNRQLLDINRQNLDVNKETFLFNTSMSLQQQHQDIDKFGALIQQDDNAITLRSSVLQSAKAQLDNGVITVHEYISQLNAENLAKQSRILHSIQLLQAQYNYKNTSGN
ncbi:TolC family protein [Chitinophaga arvensicola]|uniref:Outer membrane protein TolC n=1 Tax=Chitinophaga arvensicola TaxID=29529 RepID=A0A1I0S6R3_9BACT|nr:TolC family protein [Chitinophaga arvensicola]SEW51181.1 Outer membrane protein TolC [Chitinophaga arvensicola]